MDSRWSLVLLSVSAVWEVGRAGCLRRLGDLGKMSVTCVDGHSSAKTRSPSHCVPRPLHCSMFHVAVSNCLSEVAPAGSHSIQRQRLGHEGPKLRARDYKREKLKLRRGR